MRAVVTVAALSLALVACKEYVQAEEPGQSGVVNPMTERGSRAFEQRQKDCWDMPNAQACYEVGMNYELGIAGEADEREALKYYRKACLLDKKRDHCDAARRVRDDRKQ